MTSRREICRHRENSICSGRAMPLGVLKALVIGTAGETGLSVVNDAAVTRRSWHRGFVAQIGRGRSNE